MTITDLLSKTQGAVQPLVPSEDKDKNTSIHEPGWPPRPHGNLIWTSGAQHSKKYIFVLLTSHVFYGPFYREARRTKAGGVVTAKQTNEQTKRQLCVTMFSFALV